MATALYTYRGGCSSRVHRLGISTSRNFPERKKRMERRIRKREGENEKETEIVLIQPRGMHKQEIITSLHRHPAAISLVGSQYFCLYIVDPKSRKRAKESIRRKKLRTTKIKEEEGIIYVQPENAFKEKEVSRALERFKNAIEEELRCSSSKDRLCPKK